MHVVRGGKTPAANDRLAEAETLVRGRGNREPEEGEPRQGRQHERPQQRGHRKEDDDPDDEGTHERALRRPCRRCNHNRPDVGAGEQRRRSPEHESLRRQRVSGRELRDRCDRQPEEQRGPESLAVEPDRLRDDLPDRAFLRRQRRRERFRHPARTVSASAAAALHA